ncbi:beta-galactosidase BoGH2A precursor [mine drainage metagenome]|uniref:Beta-galactosidase BoGH2A n=1 Tax=mine drainage metagenome TaxID=410659 RepID=A0A1J5R793_9ZZZZ
MTHPRIAVRVRPGLLLLLMLVCVGRIVAAAAVPLRQVENFNRGWHFALGDHPGAKAPCYDDSGWQRVGLPHSFSIPSFAAGNSFYVGYGWYRKQFTIPDSWNGKRLFLDFDGAFQDAEVFVNGREVGRHQGGYTGFEIEITDAAHVGRNLVAVRLNNRWNPQLAPRAGEHEFRGGLYRDVWLVATNPLHVTWYGTFVTTPTVSADSGTVNVKTEVINQSPVRKVCTVQTRVVDPSGRTLETMSSMRSLRPGQTITFDQTSSPIPHPKLWSPDHPTLYSVLTTLCDGDHSVDDFKSPLGFRWFKFTAHHGFFLNGKHLYFKGANAHQDHAGWGDAVADSGFYRDVGMLKDAGFDFIRGSHYPHAPAFASACDKLGMLFWSENCFWGTAGFNSPWGASAYPVHEANDAGFEASVKASLRDMIRINRNHPSIIVWSMCNEVFFSAPQVMPKVRRFLKELVAYSHELDPTRPAAIGGCQRGDLDKLGDVAGYNGDGARLFPNPGIPNVVTEYGSTMVDRPGEYAPGWGDLPETPGATPGKEGSWRLPWRSGEAIWCGFDHASIAGHRFGSMGLIDYFRLPKRQWYWYRNAYRHIPPPPWPKAGIPAALRLSADTTTLRSPDGTDDAQVIVTVVDKGGTALSNCPPVTLSIVSGPGQFPTGPSITFAADTDIPIRDGEAAIEFRSYHAGETLIQATSPGLRPATLKITTEGTPRFIPGVTRRVAPRPYRRYTAAAAAEAARTFGIQNPTRASTEAPGHAARLANDGNPASCWEPEPGDRTPWLSIDLERIVTVKAVHLIFPTVGSWHYRIETSPDGEGHWQVIDNQTHARPGGTARLDAVHGTPAQTRFVRIILLGWPAGTLPGVAELSVEGDASAR